VHFFNPAPIQHLVEVIRTVVTELLPFQRRLREKEQDLRLDVNGARCVMDIALR
jgi:hypothetical protein